MTMLEWAKREIELARAKEKEELEDGEFDYGGGCYDSALKAFKSLTEDGHSGYSIGLTKYILDRLIDGQPLTPIEDTDDNWNDISGYRPEEGCTEYQCKRMGSLFKYVYNDGRVTYRDINLFYCVDINNGSTYHSGLVQKIIDDMFPITMPYMPGNPLRVYCLDFLTDLKNGDFDTVGVFYVMTPSGERIDINRFFKEGEDNESGWVEIDKTEYDVRYNNQIHREEYL